MSKFGKLALLAGILAILSQGSVYAQGVQEDFFVFREWNGKIALFEDGAQEPLTVYNTAVSSLYPADAELLREGIRVKTRFEVARLIEDLELE